MAQLFLVSESVKPIENDSTGHHTHGNGGGGGDDMMQRIRELEKDLQQMKTDIAVVRSNYATKADVSEAKNSIIVWVVGAVVISQIIPSIPNILKVFFH
jgi:hypothetical protein